MTSTMPEREITEPVALCHPSGLLNNDAVGWSRTPVHDTSGIARGATCWGRNKRWEYWAVTTPRHVVALTVSDLDYAGVHEVWLLDRATGETIGVDAMSPLAHGAQLPPSLGHGPVRARAGDLAIAVDEVEGGTRLRALTSRVRLDVMAHRPPRHEAMGVVVPWGPRLFQYTVKDVARPASGRVWVDGAVHEVPVGESWAVLDHGRGRWPYRMRWNWGAGSGVVDGRTVGVQIGGQWTAGTGSSENALYLDGRVHKISEQLVWEYDPHDWYAPWHIHGERAELTFTPSYLKTSRTELGLLGTRGHQCFGHYNGWMSTQDGTRVAVRDVFGWAEDVLNRW